MPFETKVSKCFVLKLSNVLCISLPLSTLNYSFQNHRTIYQSEAFFGDAWYVTLSGNDHKRNQERFWLDKNKMFLGRRAVNHWKKFPRESVQSSSLKVLKTKLDIALRNWAELNVDPTLSNMLYYRIPEVLSNLKFPMILWNRQKQIILINSNLSFSGNKLIQPRTSHLKLISHAPMTVTWSIIRDIVMNLLGGDSKAGDSMSELLGLNC